MKCIEQRPQRARRAAGAGWAAITTVLRPAVVGPLLLSATLLAALVTVGNVATIGSLVRHLHVTALVAIVLVLVGYEAARAAQWLVLLQGLHVRAPRRVQVFTYLVGEPTRVLPIGNFVENYLLLRAAGTSFGLSAVATMTSVLLEVGAALLGLVLLGLGPWGWLRPLIVLGLAAFVLLGVDPSAAVGAMLLLRAITFGVALVIGLLTLAVLPDVTRTVLRGRPHPLALSAGTPADELETGV